MTHTTNGATRVPQDVAIVGLSCRFSGDATNPEKFWEMLCNGKSGHSETTRFNPQGFSDSGVRKHNQSVTAQGNFLKQDVGAFDTGFFGITPEEALAIDPQQRLMLEVTYEAFENAGMTMDQLAGSKTSCFIGNFTSDYREMLFRDPDAAPRYTVTGTGVSMLANRVSWFFDLRGPSVTLNTACSSSLVALHLARRSLQSGEADFAVVGGANLMLGPEMFTFFSNLNFLSRDGLSRSFDASGEGYGRGEGVAAIILKRVGDAVRDNDVIRAVVRGTATNQDGKTKAITLPSLDAQVDLIRSAYDEAGLDFHDTTYFEAHGTGTRRGDPVELEAISKTLCLHRQANSKLIVGSVKSNVGHTEATAGLAGIIKAIYMLEKGLIPATIHYDKPLPEFDLNSSKLTIPVEIKPWTAAGLRRISINSFGFGGANAHAVLDDAQSYLALKGIQGVNLGAKTHQLPNGNKGITNGKNKHEALDLLTDELSFIFSAQDQQALNRNLEVIAKHLQTKVFPDFESESEYLQDLSYTLSERRSTFKLKSVILAASAKELASKIWKRNIELVENHVAVKNTSTVNQVKSIDGKNKRRLLVDLPPYSWDHSRTYWAESRASREFRLRKQPQRGLIGAPQPTYGENEHIWRGYLRLSDEPWVQDHQVLGTIVYPAAGYIAMAIEAARDIADKGRVISRFNLRDVKFHTAAVIKEDMPLELIIQLRPHRTGTRETSASWFQFEISTCHNERSVRENCFGLLSIEYQAADRSGFALEQAQEERYIKEQYVRAQGECDVDQSPKAFYEELASVGLNYGKAFQQISKIRKSPGCSSCQVKLYSPDRSSDGESPNIIHPATLDCMIQTIFPALVSSRGRMQAAMVPILLEEISISAQIPTHAGSYFGGFSTAQYIGAREMVANFTMLDHKTLKSSVIAKGLHCAAISNAAKPTAETNENEDRSICSRLMWTPAMDLLSNSSQSKVIDSTSSLRKLGKYIEKLAYARTKLSVLGFGPTFQEVVTTIVSFLPQELMASKVLKFTFACSCERDLETAKKNQLSQYGDKLAYDVLNLQESFESQSSNSKTFDIIIISDSSSVVSNPFTEMVIQKLLSPTGKVCLLAASNLVDVGKGLSNMLKTQDLVVDFVERDLGDSSQGYELVVTSKKPDERSAVRDQDIIILEGDLPCAAALSDALMSLDQGEVSYIPIPRTLLRSSLQDIEGKICIATLEMGKSFLENASSNDFNTFKEIVRRCSSIVWVSTSDEPTGSIVTGLARTMRNENAALLFRSLQVPSKDLLNSDDLAEIVSELALSSYTDNEFKLDEGILKVSRIIRDPQMDDMVTSMVSNGDIKIKNSTLKKIGQPHKLALPRQGTLDDIYFEADEVGDKPLFDEEVEIEVKASGVNFRDVLVMMGNVSDNLIGHEASGIILRVGNKVTSFQKGDRVCTIGHGCHRSVYRTAASLVRKIPDSMSFEEGATVPLVYCTAYNALVGIAHAQKGQTILIHAAAGGVGQAAIQIANYLGLEIYATVSSELKRQLIQDSYGIKEDHIFNSRDTSFAKGVMRMTSGHGVDIVLNSLSGEQLRQSWHCLAPFGTFVEIGIKDILNNTSLEMSPFAKDATFAAFEIINLLHQAPNRLANILTNVFQLLQNGSVKPIMPLLCKPISDIEEALHLLQAGKHMGKIALMWNRDQTIPIAVTAAKPVLPEAATYILVGGFGGLGQSIAKMLASRNARHLVIISRSGAKTQDAIEFVQGLEVQGVQVRSFACDVSDEKSLKHAFETCAAEMPPIRGIIQGAMVLRDISFEKMSHSQWRDALRAKVSGTWNLHKYMPKDLDFFIILSSFMGIFGSRTQGNYAAAGAYQDSLAHYRRSQGLKAVSLDLGLMRDVSAFSRQEALSGPFKSWQKPFGLREVDVHGLIEHVIASEMATSSIVPAQIITGFGTADEAERAGIEPPYYLDDIRFSLLDSSIVATGQDTVTQEKPPDATTTATKESVGDLLKQASSLEQATDLIIESLITKVAKHLGRDQGDIDPENPLHSYGVDSLVAIEIKNWIMKEFASDVSILDITAEEPVFEFAEKVAEKSMFVSVTAA